MSLNFKFTREISIDELEIQNFYIRLRNLIKHISIHLCISIFIRSFKFCCGIPTRLQSDQAACQKRLSVPSTRNWAPDYPARKGNFYLRKLLKKRLTGRRLPYDSDVNQAVAFWFTVNGHSFLLHQLGLGAAVKQTVKRNGHYVELRCVLCATCVPCSHRSSRNVVGIRGIVKTSLYYWQLRVGD
jgi:hypothetical protein